MRESAKKFLKSMLSESSRHHAQKTEKKSTEKTTDPSAQQNDPTELDYGDNIVVNHPELDNSKIIFEGKNNILFCEEKFTLRKSEVRFTGDNAVIYLSKNKAKQHHLGLLFVSFNSVIFIGPETKFNMGRAVDIHAMDGKHIIIGEDCLFSWNPWVFTSDGHPIYDTETKKRLNPGRSVLIGDHVWIGQGVSILKGSVIGSGAVIGSNAVLSGKRYSSNSSYAGMPARQIKQGIFFTKQDIKHADPEKLKSTTEHSSEKFIYSYDKKEQLTLEEIERGLSAAKTAKKKLAYIQKHLAGQHGKNRFYVATDEPLAKKSDKATR